MSDLKPSMTKVTRWYRVLSADLSSAMSDLSARGERVVGLDTGVQMVGYLNPVSWEITTEELERP